MGEVPRAVGCLPEVDTPFRRSRSAAAERFTVMRHSVLVRRVPGVCPNERVKDRGWDNSVTQRRAVTVTDFRPIHGDRR